MDIGADVGSINVKSKHMAKVCFLLSVKYLCDVVVVVLLLIRGHLWYEIKTEIIHTHPVTQLHTVQYSSRANVSKLLPVKIKSDIAAHVNENKNMTGLYHYADRPV